MTNEELEEQQSLPSKYRPLTAWEYFGLTILYSIPLIGFIFLVMHALSDLNINKRSFARSFFCVLILLCIIIGICLVITGALGVLGTISNT